MHVACWHILYIPFAQLRSRELMTSSPTSRPRSRLDRNRAYIAHYIIINHDHDRFGNSRFPTPRRLAGAGARGSCVCAPTNHAWPRRRTTRAGDTTRSAVVHHSSRAHSQQGPFCWPWPWPRAGAAGELARSRGSRTRTNKSGPRAGAGCTGYSSPAAAATAAGADGVARPLSPAAGAP